MVNETHTIKKTVFFALLLVISTSAVCQNMEYGSDSNNEADSLVFANPIDSLVYYMEQERDEDDYIEFNRDPQKVYEYLMAHPDFVKKSDSIGHKTIAVDMKRTCYGRIVATSEYTPFHMKHFME